MGTALFVVYLLALLGIILGGLWGLRLYRDVRAELRDATALARAAQTTVDSLRATLARAGDQANRLDLLAAQVERIRPAGGRAEDPAVGETRAAVARLESHVRVLVERVTEAQGRLNTLTDRVQAVESGSLLAAQKERAMLAEAVCELGAAQTAGMSPTRAWLRGHLLLLPAAGDADARKYARAGEEEIADKYARAAEDVGLEAVHESEPGPGHGGRTFGLRVTQSSGSGAVGALADRIEQRLDQLQADDGPSPRGALADLLLAAAATGHASVLLGTLLSVTDGDETRVYLLDAGQPHALAEVAEALAGPGFDPDRQLPAGSRAVELGAWFGDQCRAWRAAARQAAAVQALKDKMRPDIVRELRKQITDAEAPGIMAELRAFLEPIVRLELEHRFRPRPDADGPQPS